jgi:hypothetical protein
MPGALMANHPPYSVVLTYNEDLQQLVVHTIDPSRLAPLVAGRMGVVMADEHCAGSAEHQAVHDIRRRANRRSVRRVSGWK